MLEWTALHAALGVRPTPLNWTLIQRAISEKTAETEDLDWKSTLPNWEVPRARDEVAKDVAAMANTRGGLIVFGVQEKRGSGTAESMKPVDVSESTRVKLRSTTANLIHPFVSGLDVVAVTQRPGDAEGILVVAVPASLDAPHLVGAQDKFGCPYRDGPTTRWMRERDLEAAYRTRFDARAEHRSRVREVLRSIDERVSPARLWIAGVAIPQTLGGRTLGTASRSDFVSMLQASLTRSAELVSTNVFERDITIRELGNGALNPRVGLRKWIAVSPGDGSPDELTHYAYAELHHDGIVAFALALSGWNAEPREGTYDLPVPLVESFCIDLVAMIDAAGAQRGSVASYAVEVSLLRADENLPVAPIARERHGNFVLNTPTTPGGSRYLKSFQQVATDLTAPNDDIALLDAARILAGDVLAQFGIGTLSVIPSPR